jgi:hypothetical protein
VLWASSLSVRWLNDSASVTVTLVVLWLLWFFSSFLYLVSSFAEEGIVIRKQGVFKAVSDSMKLFVSHVGHIVFVIILLVVISIRIFLSAIAFVLLPVIVVGIALGLMTFLSKILSALIAGAIGVVLLAVVSYFFSYLVLFQQTVWTLTYMELSKLKDVDVIDEAIDTEQVLT